MRPSDSLSEMPATRTNPQVCCEHHHLKIFAPREADEQRQLNLHDVNGAEMTRMLNIVVGRSLQYYLHFASICTDYQLILPRQCEEVAV